MRLGLLLAWMMTWVLASCVAVPVGFDAPPLPVAATAVTAYDAGHSPSEGTTAATAAANGCGDQQSASVVLVHNTCLANATRLASGSADELVDLYRAVSPNEFDDIFRIGGFRPHPGGRSLGAKQFGRNLDEVVELARGFPDAAAVVHVRVPARLLQRFDLTPVDSSILRAGSVTVHEELLGALNRSIVGGVRHAF